MSWKTKLCPQTLNAGATIERDVFGDAAIDAFEMGVTTSEEQLESDGILECCPRDKGDTRVEREPTPNWNVHKQKHRKIGGGECKQHVVLEIKLRELHNGQALQCLSGLKLIRWKLVLFSAGA